jgi:hypothetical protein
MRITAIAIFPMAVMCRTVRLNAKEEGSYLNIQHFAQISVDAGRDDQHRGTRFIREELNQCHNM